MTVPRICSHEEWLQLCAKVRNPVSRAQLEQGHATIEIDGVRYHPPAELVASAKAQRARGEFPPLHHGDAVVTRVDDPNWHERARCIQPEEAAQ